MHSEILINLEYNSRILIGRLTKKPTFMWKATKI